MSFLHRFKAVRIPHSPSPTGPPTDQIKTEITVEVKQRRQEESRHLIGDGAEKMVDPNEKNWTTVGKIKYHHFVKIQNSTLKVKKEKKLQAFQGADCKAKQ